MLLTMISVIYCPRISTLDVDDDADIEVVEAG
jgi:hypothetical protein